MCVSPCLFIYAWCGHPSRSKGNKLGRASWKGQAAGSRGICSLPDPLGWPLAELATTQHFLPRGAHGGPDLVQLSQTDFGRNSTCSSEQCLAPSQDWQEVARELSEWRNVLAEPPAALCAWVSPSWAVGTLCHPYFLNSVQMGSWEYGGADRLDTATLYFLELRDPSET